MESKWWYRLLPMFGDRRCRSGLRDEAEDRQRDHENQTESRAEPEVRIQFPPADSPSLARFSPSCIEKPAVAAVCAGPVRRHGRQRHVGLVNIEPTAGNVSVGHFSSTTVPAGTVLSTVVPLVRQARSG